MPHQCVRCNTFYADEAKEIITGCSKCTGKLFFYVKQAKVEQAREMVANLSDDQKAELEEDVADIVGHDADVDNAVVLDLESIHVTSPGKYELDLVQLFMEGKPVIYKFGEGKYVIDIASTFHKMQKAKVKALTPK
jgi:predicted  nucleic acid-binding Zn-ribbon protein